MKKVLIFGASGFSGWHFQEYIQKHHLTDEYIFVGVDKSIRWKFESIKIREQDLLTEGSIENILVEEQPDYLLNLVGIFRGTNYDSFLRINAGVTQEILEVLVKQEKQPEKILLVGSAAEYGNNPELPLFETSELHPVNFYGLSKVIQSHIGIFYQENFGLPVIIARPFNILGEGLSTNLSIASFANQIKDAKPGDKIEVGNLNTRRDFLDISDVIDAYWKLLIKGSPGEIYNIARGKSHSIKSVLETLIEFSGKKLEIEVNPRFIKKHDILDSYGSNRKLREELNWKSSVSIRQSLEKML